MFDSCLKKQKEVIQLFANCKSPDEKYQKIIELGKSQSHLNPAYKTEENLVKGCQSRMYLRAYFSDGKVYFESDADALISAGLGALLVMVYSGEEPEVILKCPPAYIEELNIYQTLTPGRANGLAAVYLRLKQEALRFYTQAH